jgi:hypothetical protein
LFFLSFFGGLFKGDSAMVTMLKLSGSPCTGEFACRPRGEARDDDEICFVPGRGTDTQQYQGHIYTYNSMKEDRGWQTAGSRGRRDVRAL